MVNFLDDVYKESISNKIRERRRKKKQRDQEILVISQDVAKIPEVTDILISEQDEQDLSQQPQVNISKLTCNLETVKILHDWSHVTWRNLNIFPNNTIKKSSGM